MLAPPRTCVHCCPERMGLLLLLDQRQVLAHGRPPCRQGPWPASALLVGRSTHAVHAKLWTRVVRPALAISPAGQRAACSGSTMMSNSYKWLIRTIQTLHKARGCNHHGTTSLAAAAVIVHHASPTCTAFQLAGHRYSFICMPLQICISCGRFGQLHEPSAQQSRRLKPTSNSPFAWKPAHGTGTKAVMVLFTGAGGARGQGGGGVQAGGPELLNVP